MFAESGEDWIANRNEIPTSSIHAIHIAEIHYLVEMYDID